MPELAAPTFALVRSAKNSKKPREAWWLIRVSTAAHVVFDDIEAKGTTCTLFYDSKDGETVNIEGLRIQTKDVKRDICKLLCVVCDSNLADKIDKYVDKFVAAWERVFDKFFRDDEFENEKLAVIVHHPHGYFKHVSIGRWKEKFTEKQGDAILKQYMYDTPTCPGSAGALVLYPLNNLVPYPLNSLVL
ncbi:hypothetical protein Btru_012368 [Bulinus truncatus]|nr:hypothetical protein Btru_012368 [Bulinus truncatus]